MPSPKFDIEVLLKLKAKIAEMPEPRHIVYDLANIGINNYLSRRRYLQSEAGREAHATATSRHRAKTQMVVPLDQAARKLKLQIQRWRAYPAEAATSNADINRRRKAAHSKVTVMRDKLLEQMEAEAADIPGVWLAHKELFGGESLTRWQAGWRQAVDRARPQSEQAGPVSPVSVVEPEAFDD